MSYTLIIAEKPSAAQRIASALAEGKSSGEKENAPFYKIKRDGKDIIVTSAVGHLFVLQESDKSAGWTYPIFSVKWKPVFEANAKAIWAKRYFDNLKKLVKGADSFISACDYDIEGSVIAYNVLRFICNTEKAKRMHFSTLTKSDLVHAYENASPELDWPQIEAGLTRHQLDWYFGINMSRALTLALEHGGGYKTLSTGRVQGPTLQIMEERQEEIKAFQPKPFWQVQLTALFGKDEIIAMHEHGDFWGKKEAEGALKNCRGKDAVITEIDKKEHSQLAPFPFDLTTLQRDAYSTFGFSPKRTLDIAQSLYEQALISYPRTSSQQLSPKIGFSSILKALSAQSAYSKHCGQLLKKSHLKPRDGPKTDPAHPAIFPTGAKPKSLIDQQKKLYDMIVKRFLATFGDPAVRETTKITISVGDEKFSASGTRTVEPGWIELYKPYVKFKEQEMPLLKKGQKADKMKGIEMLEKETQPPQRYTQASVLKEMESNGLGTKATRALILQTLYDRGYIRDESIVVTALGEAVTKSLSKYCPEIVSVELTKLLEQDMEAVQEGKKKREQIIKDAETELRKILEKFKKNELAIGKVLLEGVRATAKTENTIGKCTCGGDLVIRKSKAGKRFVGCTSYPNCTQTFSLPHEGSITILPEKCPKCGLHTVLVRKMKKRPWKLCVRDGFINAAPKSGTEPAASEPKA